MIEFTLAHADLARVRFAHSPAWELMASVRVLRDPSRHHVYRDWVATASGRLAGVRMGLLHALVPLGRYVPDFLTPPPSGVDSLLTDELVDVAATSPDRVRRDLDRLRDGRPVPAVLRALYDDPERCLPAVVEAMERYWRAAVSPVWSRVRALALADIGYRMEQFRAGGLAQVLSGLHPDVLFTGDRVLVREECELRASLGGRGLLLVPCVFGWPGVMVTGPGGRGQPGMCYPPRGLATIGERSRPAGTGALSALLGRTRAGMLTALELPLTTTQLAQRLDVTPAAVSQHLRILKDSALVASRRNGRTVLYQRTTTATALLNAGALASG
jgi:DNA-binding transcriptional ArsR family regulator